MNSLVKKLMQYEASNPMREAGPATGPRRRKMWGMKGQAQYLKGFRRGQNGMISLQIQESVQGRARQGRVGQTFRSYCHNRQLSSLTAFLQAGRRG